MTIKDRIIHWFYAAARLTFVFFNNLYCIPTYLVWTLLILRPMKYFNQMLYFKIENILYEWLLQMVAAWSFGANYIIEEVGENVTSCYDDESLVIANHQSTADVPMLMYCFQDKPGLTRRLSWIMDKMFKWTNFGLVSIVHGDFFIASGKHIRDEILVSLRKYLLTVYQSRGYKWIILFPEGGFLYKRKQTSQNYAVRNNMPVLENVSLPRFGAMQEILTTLSKDNLKKIVPSEGAQRAARPIKWVIDMTVAYPKGKPLDLLMITGATVSPCKVLIHYRCYHVNDVPTDSEQLSKWLNERWIEKDLMLKDYYDTGKFPDFPPPKTDASQINVSSSNPIRKKPHPILMSWAWIYFLHFFFISSSLFHFYVIKKALVFFY